MSEVPVPPPEENDFLTLYHANLIPLHTCLAALTWFLHDHCLTLEAEIRYVWPQNSSLGKAMFLWIRYYTLAVLIFDVVQIHTFSIPGVVNDDLCVAMDPITRVVGAVSLWSIEIIMQLRIYALYNCSKRVAYFNAALFIASVLAFFCVLIHNTVSRHAIIALAINLPLPGCPVINTGIEWAQWVPATLLELILVSFAVWKTLTRILHRAPSEVPVETTKSSVSLYSSLLRDNIFYFFGVTFLLLFNNLMALGIACIPWFSYAPFHAAIGIISTRLLLHLRMTIVEQDDEDVSKTDERSNPILVFAHGDSLFDSNDEESARVFWPGDRNKPLLPITFTISDPLSVGSGGVDVSHDGTDRLEREMIGTATSTSQS